MAETATFITSSETHEQNGPRLAVKDLIDVAGYVTTAGSKVLAETTGPATVDAACLRGARAADARIVGKTNLVELAFGVSGINPFYGTPRNPLDQSRIPGGSSSGSAVAVATGEADIAFGSDTGGSIRIPAACCGVVGLKTTFGRVPLEGVRPLAPSLDTVGPMAKTVDGVVAGMALLEPGFTVSETVPRRVGRITLTCAPFIDRAIDEALHEAGFEVVAIDVPEWFFVWEAAMVIIEHEAAVTNRELFGVLDHLDPAVAQRLQRGATLGPVTVAEARSTAARWCDRLSGFLSSCELLALPCLADRPPLVAAGPGVKFAYHSPINLAGLPAIAVPVGSKEPFRASLQLVADHGGEERLLAAALVVEAFERRAYGAEPCSENSSST